MVNQKIFKHPRNSEEKKMALKKFSGANGFSD